MLESEIVALVKLVNAGFPNAKSVPPEALPLWFEDLADLDPQHVRAAFTAYRRSGKEFPPTCAELRRLVLELQEPTPRFEHAWVAIQRAVSRHGYYAEAAAHDALLVVPMAWELVTAMGGWSCICLGGPDQGKPTDPGVWRSQAEHAWKALLEQRRTDLAVVDIPSALPRVRDAGRRLAGMPEPVLAPPAALGDVLPKALPPASPSLPALREVAAGSARQAAATAPVLRPERRAVIKEAIRTGTEATLPAQWRPIVEQVRAEMGAA